MGRVEAFVEGLLVFDALRDPVDCGRSVAALLALLLERLLHSLLCAGAFNREAVLDGDVLAFTCELAGAPAYEVLALELSELALLLALLLTPLELLLAQPRCLPVVEVAHVALDRV